MDLFIYTGCYASCHSGNLISISGDRGKLAGFNGKVISELAPKKEFWKVWKNNIGKIPEDENTYYYIQEYYRQVLSQVDIEKLLKDEIKPILLCYERGLTFCHRHILAEYIEMRYGRYVKEITISKKGNICTGFRPMYYREMLLDVMQKG